MSEFVKKNHAIDSEVKVLKAKREFIKRAFLFLDVVLSILFISVEAYLHYSYATNLIQNNDRWKIAFLMMYILNPILITIFSLVLAGSAYYLTR